MAHTSQKQINNLLKILDNERIDVFLHVDKKYKDFNRKQAEEILQKSCIYFLPGMDVRWGDLSLIHVSVKLLELAMSTNTYVYYHLISSMDMPIKPINDFMDFCESNADAEYVNFEKYCPREDMAFFHPFPRHQRCSNIHVRHFFKLITLIVLFFQRIIGVNRFRSIDFHKGSQWFSITQTCAQYVCDNKKDYDKIYKWATCGDEKFLQTLIWSNKNLREHVYPDNYGNLRLVDWKRGKPYVFREKDFEELRNSPRYWVRKIDMNVDSKIVELIEKELL